MSVGILGKVTVGAGMCYCLGVCAHACVHMTANVGKPMCLCEHAFVLCESI